MRRTCKNCKAYDEIRNNCLLGYKQKNGTPNEECPKPLSWKKFDEAKKNEERMK